LVEQTGPKSSVRLLLTTVLQIITGARRDM